MFTIFEFSKNVTKGSSYSHFLDYIHYLGYCHFWGCVQQHQGQLSIKVSQQSVFTNSYKACTLAAFACAHKFRNVMNHFINGVMCVCCQITIILHSGVCCHHCKIIFWLCTPVQINRRLWTIHSDFYVTICIRTQTRCSLLPLASLHYIGPLFWILECNTEIYLNSSNYTPHIITSLHIEESTYRIWKHRTCCEQR